MTDKPKPSPKFTDAERHARFLAMAKEVDASDDPADFERAFSTVAHSKNPEIPSRSKTTKLA
jgi:hypothetical protein